MHEQPLFRSTAVEQRGHQFLGPILLLRPLSFRLVTTTATLLAIAIIAVLFIAEYTQKTNIVGTLVPKQGMASVIAPASGTVVERRVSEGQQVRKGDVLFVISGERRTLNGGETQARVSAQLQQRRDQFRAERARQEALVAEETRALNAKVADLAAERGELEAQIAAQSARLDSFKAALTRFEALQSQGHVSALQVQQKREEGLSEQATLHALKRDRLALEREATQLRSDLNSLPLRLNSQLSSIDREIAELEQDLALAEAQREFVLTAQQEGVITALRAEPGTTVLADATLATIVPADAVLEARLQASSRDVGFIQPGKRVQLRYQSFPYQKFGQYEGHVVAVTRTTLTPSADSLTDPVYEVHVQLDSQQVSTHGQRHRLQAGMQVDAAVLLDRRRLIEWVFEPVLGFSNRVADAS